MLTLDKIYHAAFILKEVARKTDLIYAPNLSSEADIYLKTENLQVTGSFKLRGAYYKISQLTEDLVGPYALHDFYLYYMLRYDFTPTKIYHLACRAFADDFDQATIKKWLKAFYRRFFTQQFKRSCMPDGVKVGNISLSPRGDWRMPSDASARIWLEEIEKL